MVEEGVGEALAVGEGGGVRDGAMNGDARVAVDTAISGACTGAQAASKNNARQCREKSFMSDADYLNEGLNTIGKISD